MNNVNSWVNGWMLENEAAIWAPRSKDHQNGVIVTVRWEENAKSSKEAAYEVARQQRTLMEDICFNKTLLEQPGLYLKLMHQGTPVAIFGLDAYRNRETALLNFIKRHNLQSVLRVMLEQKMRVDGQT